MEQSATDNSMVGNKTHKKVQRLLHQENWAQLAFNVFIHTEMILVQTAPHENLKLSLLARLWGMYLGQFVITSSEKTRSGSDILKRLCKTSNTFQKSCLKQTEYKSSISVCMCVFTSSHFWCSHLKKKKVILPPPPILEKKEWKRKSKKQSKPRAKQTRQLLPAVL